MTSIHTHHRAIAVAVTALTITAIAAPTVSARPSQSPHELFHVSPVASTPASREQAASVLRRRSHDASADPHGMPIPPVVPSTLPRKFTTAVTRRGVAIVNVEKPLSDPSISWKVPRKVGRSGLIVRHGTYDPPPAPSRHTSTHKFTRGGQDHIPAGDLHSDRAGIHTAPSSADRPLGCPGRRRQHRRRRLCADRARGQDAELPARHVGAAQERPRTRGRPRRAAHAFLADAARLSALGDAGRGRLRLPQPAGRY